MSDECLKRKILIVDDCSQLIKLLCIALESNYKVIIATDGKKALSMAASEPHPDLILLDIDMPEMDGYEVCGRLKEDETTKNIPVIFLTAKGDKEEVAKGLALGAVDYITKPFNWPKVMATLETRLKAR